MKEGEYPDATQPLCERTPKEYAPRHPVEPRKDGDPGGGEPAHGFEVSIETARAKSNCKGQGPHCRDEEPAAELEVSKHPMSCIVSDEFCAVLQNRQRCANDAHGTVPGVLSIPNCMSLRPLRSEKQAVHNMGFALLQLAP